MKKGNFDVVIGIDMETDIGSYTDKYTGVQFGTGRLLEVFARHGIKATFFWTGHAAENNPEIVRDVQKAGHEIGCHSLFHETLGDPIFPLPNNWPVCDFEVENRIIKATEIVESISKTKLQSFRCPRLWGSTKVVNVLEKLNYKVDASLPLFFYRTMIKPYHPDYKNWTIKGDMKLLEVPNFCDLTMESNDPYQRDRDQWPLFRTEGADFLLEKIDKFIDYVKKRETYPVLCFYFHPWEFYEMPQGAIDFGEADVTPKAFITKNCGEVAVNELDKLITALKNRGATFKKIVELADEY